MLLCSYSFGGLLLVASLPFSFVAAGAYLRYVLIIYSLSLLSTLSLLRPRCVYNSRRRKQEVQVDKLAELRESQALTLRDLAERSGVDANTINQIELGHRKPRPSTLRKLAKALDVEVAEFFEESGRTSPRASAPLSFKAWLEERCGSSYLAMSMEELNALFERLDNTEHETEKLRE